VLVVLAVVFVFAVWPLHQRGYFTRSYNCGSALKASGNCDSSVVGHRRVLLLELGGGALVVGLVGLELVFGARRRGTHAQDVTGSEGPDNGDATLPELSDDVLDKLERLGRLRQSGVFTDEEFATEKSKLLA
jgi:hypothetical protein